MNFIEVTPSHDDLIHDIAFDYYGKRFATCSSDKHIKIWTIDESKGSWVSYDIPRAHQNSIWRVSWAPPEFGQLLASCSEDNTICLWEEQESTTASTSAQDRWRKFKIATCKRSVNDVKFCHRSLGLKLAAASSDGYLRIFEAVDVFDMNKWEMPIEYQVEDTNLAETGTGSNEGKASRTTSEHGLTCVSWNDCPFEAAKLAVGGYSKKVVVLSLERNNTMREECVLENHNNAVHDVAWAPAMGRSYHLIATASKEPSFKIHKLTRREDGTLAYDSTETVENSANSNTKSNIWRVTWNATGTVLATSSEDGTLSLWRRDFAGSWVNVQNLPSMAQQQMMHFYHSS